MSQPEGDGLRAEDVYRFMLALRLAQEAEDIEEQFLCGQVENGKAIGARPLGILRYEDS